VLARSAPIKEVERMNTAVVYPNQKSIFIIKYYDSIILVLVRERNLKTRELDGVLSTIYLSYIC